MIGVERYADPAIVIVGFDGIFNEVLSCDGHFGFIYICHDRTIAFVDQLNVPFCSDRSEPL